MTQILVMTWASCGRLLPRHWLYRFAAYAIATLAAFILLVIDAQSLSAKADDRPNILLIMADDIGIEGLGCYGSVSYQTPHLDRLAGEGVRFTDAFSQPLCTPTRVQIMTGKYNHRNWRSFGILDPTEKTFGHYLQQAGYATGIFGKWQLQSYDPPDLPGADQRRGTGMHPKDAGFDRYALFHSLHTEDKGSRYANPTMLEGQAGDEGTLKTYRNRYGADIWVQQILDFFEATGDRPTFVYYPMALPHWPFQPTPDTPGWDPADVPEESVEYFDDMVAYMDKAVGSLLSGLAQRGMRDNTIVLFYSDNGTHTKVVSKLADGRSIRGGKATPRQTGIHVPLIAAWPGHIQPSVCDDLVDASDFLPTLLELAGAERPTGEVFDGISFAGRLLGRATHPRQSVFVWYDPRPGWDKERFGRHVFALNKDYKLYRSGRMFQLGDAPLEEIEINPLAMTAADRKAKRDLERVIDDALSGAEEPPLVDAYGRPEIDLLAIPPDRPATDRINQQLLDSGKQVVYGDPQISAQRMWLFRPLAQPDDELRPCVFLIHGGGWGGSPRSLAPQAVYLQRRGIAAAVTHFRKPAAAGDGESAITPADTLRDARMAYRWLVEHGPEQGIDPSRLVVAGGSAGGHLSLALATIALDDDEVITHLPQGMVLWNPVIDLVDGWQGGRQRCQTFGIEPVDFSPAHHIGRGLPPMLILSGSEDSLISPLLIESFQQRTIALGNRCRAVIYPEAGHGFFNYGRHENRYFQWTMWEFEKFLRELDWDVNP